MDMEVAGHWRREWAGTAEFGNVTEGGVTRQVARAMEVLHASAPGAKVRVMRAAYHSTAGPGTPAASYLMHSSRRVISSGFNFLSSPSITHKPIIESPSTPSKPLEISSMPLDTSATMENANYKVTEPDDTEISEPSKWKVSSEAGSFRFPSEESSSTDNASIVDLDWKRKGSSRKSSCDSESSDYQYTKRNSIDIPIRLSSPTSLSTLKFKSLLNGQQSDWNNRRKSYSFEDTSPLNETVIHSNDTLAMESSTDSGICKSTELVNEPVDTKDLSKLRMHNEDINDSDQGSFKDWLSRNRRSSYHNSNRTPYREHDIIVEDTGESNVSLSSSGKVTITVPITLEKDTTNSKFKTSDDGDRKVKRVEFCKTELHFAADSGKVNIISTDDKPPPSNNFRKRRSAFVPLNENFEKPITLFGEKNNDHFNTNTFSNLSYVETTENDENTAATKSILKNKIPKPKPYLLGENMALGVSDELINKENVIAESVVPSAVLLINKQLQAGRTTLPEEEGVANNMSQIIHSRRIINDGPANNRVSSYRSLFEREQHTRIIQKDAPKVQRSPSPIKKRYNNISQLSPIPGRAQTRQLRESDLVYFGVNKSDNITKSKPNQSDLYALPSQEEDVFESVKLVLKISSSVCNSEAESEDAPEYQNISFKTNFTPVPAPRTSKLKDIAEDAVDVRRSRNRRVAEHTTTSRSISEPPKFGRNSLERANRRRNPKNVDADISAPRSKKRDDKRINVTIHEDEDQSIMSNGKVSPLYVNIGVKDIIHGPPKNKFNASCPEQRQTPDITTKKVSSSRRVDINSKTDLRSLEKQQQSTKRTRQRTEKLATPEHSDESIRRANGDIRSSIRRKRSVSAHDTRGLHKKDVDEYNLTTKSISPTNKIHSKTRPSEDTVKNANQKVEKTTLERKKSSRVLGSSPNAASIITSQEKQISGNTSNDTSKRSTSSSANIKIYTSSRAPEGKSNKYRRSEYVINYDDKNGTVSSICKITPPQSSTTKKHKIPKELKDKPKASDKISLLQLPERDWLQNDNSYTGRKKKKINIQRSCQLL